MRVGLDYLYPIHELLYHIMIALCVTSGVHKTCGLEPSADINTVPTPLPLDIILGPQTLSLVFPSTPTSGSTAETRWVRLYISPLHSALKKTELTPE